jgi:hypothetical protein
VVVGVGTLAGVVSMALLLAGTSAGSSCRYVVVGVGALTGVVSMALLLAGTSAGDTRNTALMS